MVLSMSSTTATSIVVNFAEKILLSEAGDMKEWLEENNISYGFKHAGMTFTLVNIIGVYFDLEEDAMAFKLRWL